MPSRLERPAYVGLSASEGDAGWSAILSGRVLREPSTPLPNSMVTLAVRLGCPQSRSVATESLEERQTPGDQAQTLTV
jgi:hypothetical protein